MPVRLYWAALIVATLCVSLTDGAAVKLPDMIRMLAQPKPSPFLQSLSSYEVVPVSFIDTANANEPVHLSSAFELSFMPSRLAASFRALGREFSLELERNDALFHPKYSESQQVWIDGQRRKELEAAPRTLADVPKCHYQGRVNAVDAPTYTTPRPPSSSSHHLHRQPELASMNADAGDDSTTSPKPVSLVAVSTCARSQLEGLDGVIVVENVAYGVKPALAHLTAEVLEDHLTRFALHALSTSTYSSTSSFSSSPPASGATAGAAPSLQSSSMKPRLLSSPPPPAIRAQNLHVLYRLDAVDRPLGTCGVTKTHNGRENVDFRSPSPFGAASASMLKTNTTSLTSSSSSPSSSSSQADGHNHNHDHNVADIVDTIAGLQNMLQTPEARATLKAIADARTRRTQTTTPSPPLPTNTSLSTQSMDPLSSSSTSNNSSSSSRSSSGSSSGGGFYSLQAVPDDVYVELLVANDNARYLQELANTETDAAALINVVSSLYNSNNMYPRIHVVLTSQVTFPNNDPWSIAVDSNGEVSVSELLAKWNNWRSTPGNAPAHDNGQLLSGYDFAGATLGYAGVGVMCNPAYSGGIDQTLNGQLAFTGAVIAHEMGHNFGCQHDSVENACPPSGYIMNAIISNTVAPTEFSSCSKAYVQSFVDPSVSCIFNVPTSTWTNTPVCGNGLVEENEDCDCGQADCSVVDPCCDGTTCKFRPGAECSFLGGCCSTACKIIPASAKLVCRAAKSECDLAETCSGSSGTCPEDYYKGPGHSCSTASYGAGICYRGSCVSHLQQCRDDTKGYANGPYNNCPDAVQRSNNNGNFCGTMFCRAQSASTGCSYFTQSGIARKINDGIACSTNSQCFEGACKLSADINNRYIYVYGEWSSCFSCSEQQMRNATCYDTVKQVTVASKYLSFVVV